MGIHDLSLVVTGIVTIEEFSAGTKEFPQPDVPTDFAA
jgi:hypothetical protein